VLDYGKIRTTGQVTVAPEERRRLCAPASVGASAAASTTALYLQGSIIELSRSGMQMEAIFAWKTVSDSEMNPRSINSVHT